MITGDHYANCEPDLAKWCCKCENNNLTTFDHMCRECEYATNGFNRCVSRVDAQRFYGVKDFWMFSEDSQNSNRYYIYELEKHMLQKCGSKMAWVREFAAQRARSEEAQRRKEERESVIAQLDPDFKEYIYSFKTTRAGKSARYTALERCQTKFKELKAALTERGLPPTPDFNYCQAFIMMRSGNLDQVVDNMEENHFLFTQRIGSGRRWGVHQTYPEDVKADLCVQYLQDNKDVTIPQKWEKCRQRFDEVVSENLDPKVRALYIYSGEVSPEVGHLETR
ncbi:hypothetical protein DVH05_009450 [Phytophthora capsici]|nr:hypothetical protein DVH05_009450 [Phytophthora capsici]